MTSTEWTPAPAFSGRQVGQILAGRYRLAMYKGGDDIAEVWHAVEESTQRVVTVEILRDRDDESRRARFLEQAHRMAEIERPSVMKVAAIHNESTDTFVVFEHLIPLPVELPDAPLSATAVAPPPEAATAPPPEAVAAPLPEWVATQLPDPAAAPPPGEVAAPLPETVAAPMPEWVTPTHSADPVVEPDATARYEPVIKRLEPVTSDKSAVVAAKPLSDDFKSLLDDPSAVDDTEPVIVEMDEPSAPTVVMTPRARPGALQEVTRNLTLVKGDLAWLASSAMRFLAPARPFVRRLHLDRLATAVRARIPPSLGAQITAGAARVVKQAGPMMANARPMIAKAGPLLVRARPLIDRARHNQIVMAVITAAIVLTIFIASPLDDAIAGALRPKAAAVPATTAPTAPLSRAPFALPPLSAYRAAFESQAAFPTAVQNGALEWVVALRNTGSVGWYRGIEGAQVALALADGTGVAVQSTDYVAPGQVGWFVVHFRARAETGTYLVPLLPRVDGLGPLPDLGIHAIVTVTKP